MLFRSRKDYTPLSTDENAPLNAPVEADDVDENLEKLKREQTAALKKEQAKLILQRDDLQQLITRVTALPTLYNEFEKNHGGVISYFNVIAKHPEFKKLDDSLKSQLNYSHKKLISGGIMYEYYLSKEMDKPVKYKSGFERVREELTTLTVSISGILAKKLNDLDKQVKAFECLFKEETNSSAPKNGK